MPSLPSGVYEFFGQVVAVGGDKFVFNEWSGGGQVLVFDWLTFTWTFLPPKPFSRNGNFFQQPGSNRLILCGLQRSTMQVRIVTLPYKVSKIDKNVTKKSI
jgi:hypothetical protein